MNKTKWTVLVSVAVTVIAAMVLPWVILLLDGSRGALGWFILLLLTFNPLVLAAIGIASGLQWRKLWWLPLTCAVLMPLLYSVTLSTPAVGLFAYFPLYLIAGFLPFGITCGVVIWREKARGATSPD